MRTSPIVPIGRFCLIELTFGGNFICVILLMVFVNTSIFYGECLVLFSLLWNIYAPL